MKKAILIPLLLAGSLSMDLSYAQQRGPGGNDRDQPGEQDRRGEDRRDDDRRGDDRRDDDRPNDPRNPDGPRGPQEPNDPREPDEPEEPEEPGEPGEPDEPEEPGEPEAPQDPTANDEQLLQLISDLNMAPITGDGLPSIDDPLPQLGKSLFFAKNLGGEQTAACVSCHHPVLGGSDNLSLSVGVDAINDLNVSSDNLLGHGRFNGNDANNLPSVPRNAPTMFNAGLNETRMFWDGRVERRNNGILTPDSEVNNAGNRIPDSNLTTDTTIATAQARFPVTSPDEMRGDFEFDLDNEAYRAVLSERLNDTSTLWPQAFETAYGDTTVNFDRAAEAIGEYERSMVFVNSPWNQYLAGDLTAMTEDEKAGAVLFFTTGNQGGAGCGTCHAGSALEGVGFQLVAFPHFGPGQGNPSVSGNNQDYGRENVTGEAQDRFHFRAPSLLNIAQTAPYGHAGAYQTLEEVVRHYANPERAINRLFGANNNNEPFAEDSPFCQLPQIADLSAKNGVACESLYPDAYENSMQVVEHLQAARNGTVDARIPLRGSPGLDQQEVAQIVAFLEALTDPCVVDRECLDPWIVDQDDEASFPDSLPLIAEDRNGDIL